jgi:hypothetical protein
MLSVGLGIHAPVKTARGDSTASSMLPLTPHAAYRRNSRLVVQAQPDKSPAAKWQVADARFASRTGPNFSRCAQCQFEMPIRYVTASKPLISITGQTVPICYNSFDSSARFLTALCSHACPPGSPSNSARIFSPQAITFSPTLRLHKSFIRNTYKTLP